MSCNDLKVGGFMYEHIIERSGVKVRGERKNPVAPLTFALVVEKEGLWLFQFPCLDLNKNMGVNQVFPLWINCND